MADRILWLHFGIQKTGSSSFQFLLHKYQEKLRDAGVVYLDPYFSLSPNPWCPAEVTSRALFEQKKFSQFFKLINYAKASRSMRLFLCQGGCRRCAIFGTLCRHEIAVVL